MCVALRVGIVSTISRPMCSPPTCSKSRTGCRPRTSTAAQRTGSRPRTRSRPPGSRACHRRCPPRSRAAPTCQSRPHRAAPAPGPDRPSRRQRGGSAATVRPCAPRSPAESSCRVLDDTTHRRWASPPSPPSPRATPSSCRQSTGVGIASVTRPTPLPRQGDVGAVGSARLREAGAIGEVLLDHLAALPARDDQVIAIHQLPVSLNRPSAA
jgi:hypothetical protein